MAISKQQKIKFVEDAKSALNSYSTVGVVQLTGVPDKLLQLSRNRLKPEIKFMLGRKNLLLRALESMDKGKELADRITNTSALVFTNLSPFELNKKLRSNELKLAAKPKQIAPTSISIDAGETAIPPGQGVTDLKSAGIDVKIDKGKVVIAKSKVLVEKGQVITPAVAKALRLLDFRPFTASIAPALAISGKMLFTQEVLSINSQSVVIDISTAFAKAVSLSTGANIVNRYTIKPMIGKAYTNAIALGVERTLYEPGIIERLLAKAGVQASQIDTIVK